MRVSFLYGLIFFLVSLINVWAYHSPYGYRDFISIKSSYVECKSWEAILRRHAMDPYAYNFNEHEIELLEKIKQTCENLRESMQHIQHELHEYRDYYNAVVRNQAAPQITERLRHAYQMTRQNYDSRHPTPHFPYAICTPNHRGGFFG